ncbi:hypothetical protein GCM10023083_72880 [Streptomyces phyllanthi]
MTSTIAEISDSVPDVRAACVRIIPLRGAPLASAPGRGSGPVRRRRGGAVAQAVQTGTAGDLLWADAGAVQDQQLRVLAWGAGFSPSGPCRGRGDHALGRAGQALTGLAGG